MKRVLTVIVAAVLASGAAAQSLRSLLPPDAVAVIGVQGLSQQQAKLQPFIDEFNRLGVADAFQAAFASTEKSAEKSANVPNLTQMPKELEGLSLLDIVGNEAYLAVSVNQTNPLPAVTLVARVDAKAQQAAAKLIQDQAGNSGVQRLTEGKLDFYVETVDDGGGSKTTVAYAQDGALVVISSNPDVLRGVLRRQQGSSEPAFTDQPGYKSTLAQLGNGQLVTYIDPAPAGPVLKPILDAQSMDALSQRLTTALTTFGVSAHVTRLTQTGFEGQGLQQLDGSGKDVALYTMLGSDAAASTDALGFVPPNALSVGSSAIAITDWWNYLGDLVASVPQLGVSDLDQFVQGMVGIDLRTDLFDWAGHNVATISMPASSQAAQQPGMPNPNLLGSSVFVLQSKDDAAATKGLADLFGKLAAQLASFTNPNGKAPPPQPSTHQAGGLSVTSLSMAPGVTISYAVTGGQAFIGTSGDALDAVLTARQHAGTLPPKLAALRSRIPDGAHSFSLTDSQASMKNSSASLVTGLQTLAGIGGSQNLDMAKVTKATDALTKFLDFVAAKLGSAVSYTQVSNGKISSHSLSQVSW
jgi:hypothetical protein